MMRNYIRLKDGSVRHFRRPMEMMGIINLTPDSFYAGSRIPAVRMAVDKAACMMAEGATCIDLGAESTRPGADPVDSKTEMARILPAVEQIRRLSETLLISVDTRNADTAAAAVACGADIINDVSGLTHDERMAETVARLKVPLILMHAQGDPKTMQMNPQYRDPVTEVKAFFEERLRFAHEAGIAADKIILDLGIGFGKTQEHNLALLRRLDVFLAMGYPHLLAVSRKSFIGHVTGRKTPEERLYGTVALSVYAAMHGVQMARVHDVRANADAVRAVEYLR